MFNHYIKIAWRNIAHSRGFSFLNIAGLAVGMAVAMLIGLWLMDEFTYDQCHKKYDRIYQAYMVDYFGDGGESATFPAVPLPLVGALANDFPEVKYAAESDWGWPHSLVIGDKRFFEKGLQVNGDFLKIFTFPLLAGNEDTALDDPYSIVLTESMAASIFGENKNGYENVIGQTLRVDDRADITITGIITDPPDNATHQFKYLMPFSQWETWAEWLADARSDWGNNSFKVYFELNEGVDENAFSEKIKGIVQANFEESDAEIIIHPMKKWRLYSNWENGKASGGYITYVRLFGIIGLFVLLIACINFMNLSTARSEKRAKEVGIRKTVGSGRGQLIGQFLGETLMLVIIAFAVSVGLVEFALPWFNELTVKQMIVPYANPVYILLVLSFVLLTGLLAGSYPAFFLSAFKPIGVLKAEKGKIGGNRFRQILVVTQFTVSVALIIGTIVIWQQVEHAQNRDMGYNADRLLSILATQDLIDNYDVLKTEMFATGAVESLARSSSPITAVYSNMGNVEWPGQDPNDETGFAIVATATDYTKTVGVKMLEGRDFSADMKSDTTAVIFNIAAIERMSLENPIGQTIKWGEGDFTIIGVMENIVMESPFSPVRPAMFVFNPDWHDQLLFRLSPNADIKNALARLEPIFEKHSPSYPFDYKFVDEEYGRKFRQVSMVGSIATVFGGLAIFISCLGLFGLAAYMAERRTKEIGIRKVLGASVFNLWGMLSQDFLLLVLLSSFLAAPLAAYFLDDWLAQYEYRIDLNWWVFILAVILAVTVTLFTVSFQSIKAALANPVESLRSD